jgi:hypothetical protein
MLQINRNEQDRSLEHNLWLGHRTAWMVPMDDTNTITIGFNRYPKRYTGAISMHEGDSIELPAKATK